MYLAQLTERPYTPLMTATQIALNDVKAQIQDLNALLANAKDTGTKKQLKQRLRALGEDYEQTQRDGYLV